MDKVGMLVNACRESLQGSVFTIAGELGRKPFLRGASAVFQGRGTLVMPQRGIPLGNLDSAVTRKPKRS